METESYVTEFLRHYRNRDYRRACDVFLKYGDDLVARLGREDVPEIFTEFILFGMIPEATELYQSAKRLGRNDLVMGMDMELFLLDLGAAKGRMITKKN
ncbi:hypothetical protein HY500_01870 [Candidatus Woesearchaeota archaeon]|nr:hypothetical protein [Candidatus Woesearchaeota archaeon]